MSDLLPCPFCGAPAERFTLGEGEPDNAGGDVITCTRCQASSHVEFGRKENLVDCWNTRATAVTSDLREALEGIIHFSDAVAYRDDTLSVSLRQWINRAETLLSEQPA
ncbi:Lar family restriction alleviation protein [Sphingopyxis witflariensis]|uniref:Restriction alleviation protein, Lar family n=1 Tax=Sphingopyxis witflariensis TaxID=173675 RepID=A0A246JYA3_9SPHN|nr:Lar family restriction alleviation protein [Sphingopyxis witflariensis]OWQ97987.1 hypothetical protein CDQ91_10225 [Sphingopyxis witflariensis]